MMLLIAMAITVAYVGVDGHVARLVRPRLLVGAGRSWSRSCCSGHWQEMKALGQAQDALAALAALLPDEAERVGPDGAVETVALDDLRPGDVVLVRAGGRVPADGEIVDGDGRARRVDDHRRVAGRSPRASATGSSPAPCRPTRRSGSGSTRSATTPRWPASSAWSPRRRSRGRGPRSSPTAPPRCSSTSRPAAAAVTVVVWLRHRRHRRGRRPGRDRAGHLLPARPRPRHPADDLAVVGASRPATGSWSRTASPWSRAAPSTPSCSTRPAPSPRASTPSSASPAPASTTTRSCASPAAVESDSEHPLARAIVAAAARAGRRRRRRRTSGRSPAEASRPTSTATRYAVGGPALLRERSLDRAGRRSAAWSPSWKDRGAAVLYLVRGDDDRRRVWPSRTRSGPRPARRSPSCSAWAAAS